MREWSGCTISCTKRTWLFCSFPKMSLIVSSTPSCVSPIFLQFFGFLDNDYSIPPTAKMIHLLALMLPLITMSITSRYSMIPPKFLQMCSSVKCTLPPSRAGTACCEDSKANVNDANDARPNFHIYPVNLCFMLGHRTHDIPFPVLADSHYHDATSIDRSSKMSARNSHRLIDCIYPMDRCTQGSIT